MKDPLRWTTPLTVHVGSGIVQVLQLDDTGVREDYGVAVEFVNKRTVSITGSPGALQKVADDCNYRAQGAGWDQPLWYANSARAAAKRIGRVLRGAGV